MLATNPIFPSCPLILIRLDNISEIRY